MTSCVGTGTLGPVVEGAAAAVVPAVDVPCMPAPLEVVVPAIGGTMTTGIAAVYGIPTRLRQGTVTVNVPFGWASGTRPIITRRTTLNETHM